MAEERFSVRAFSVRKFYRRNAERNLCCPKTTYFGKTSEIRVNLLITPTTFALSLYHLDIADVFMFVVKI